MAARRGDTIAATSFPLYTLRVVGDRHLLVAGGGGAAKTGIDNAIEIFELKRDSVNNQLLAHKVTHHTTGDRAIMNCAITCKDKQFILAAGLEGSCAVYSMRYKFITPKVENEVNEGLRKRKGNLTVSADHILAVKMIGFELEQEFTEIITDRSKDGGFQKAVVFSPDLSHIITGGADGYLRLWKFPSMEAVTEQKAHVNEIDDVDISLDGMQIVTVSKDNHIYLWKAEDLSLIRELIFPTDMQYRARNCRFAAVADDEKADVLFTTHISSVRGRRADPAYIVKWGRGKDRVEKVINTGTDILSALAVSDNGTFVAVGTISGSVFVYTAVNLQVLYHMPEIHRIFVTGLEFMPSSEAARAVVGDFDFNLFSISADNQIKVHQYERRDKCSALLAVMGFLLVVFLIFWFMTAFDIIVHKAIP